MIKLFQYIEENPSKKKVLAPIGAKKVTLD